jgi:hypothetical protein
LRNVGVGSGGVNVGAIVVLLCAIESSELQSRTVISHSISGVEYKQVQAQDTRLKFGMDQRVGTFPLMEACYPKYFVLIERSVPGAELQMAVCFCILVQKKKVGAGYGGG